ncbi:MAG: hypothetical protein MAG431_02105 [Chloroflexi bacterium]|nr:hypothetical protein [Chloroflexota bacterium]
MPQSTNLPTSFQFSQSSLQDFVDCPRRFELKYLRELAWPAIEAEPVLEHEQLMQLGSRFHQLIHQHLSGIPAERLTQTIDHPNLTRWWHNYLDHGPDFSGFQVSSEIPLSAALGGHRLIAKYDVLAIKPGEQALIIDWKTSRKKTARQWLQESLQTSVYPYLLVQAGAELNGGEGVLPEQVEMIYWFPEAPSEPERFSYNAKQYTADHDRLTSLSEQIIALGRDEEQSPFRLTADERRCRFCVYRSLCERGEGAGDLYEREELLLQEEELVFELDFEQIGEMEY